MTPRPPMMNLDSEVEFALDAAQQAAALVARVRARGFTVARKSGDDPVTEADRASNELLVALLRARCPGDAVCAEESDLALSAREAARGGRCWFIDPLDGTREFVRGSDEFCVMVGLAIAGAPVLGAVVAPAWRRAFVGTTGEGRWQGAWEIAADGGRRPLQVGPPRAPARVVLSRLHRNPAVEDAARRLGIDDVRVCGSTGLKFMLVASGEVDLYLHTGAGPSLWDGCAPEAIARAAGAAVSDAAGQPLRYDTFALALDRGIVAGAPALCAAALQALSRGA